MRSRINSWLEKNKKFFAMSDDGYFDFFLNLFLFDNSVVTGLVKNINYLLVCIISNSEPKN